MFHFIDPDMSESFPHDAVTQAADALSVIASFIPSADEECFSPRTRQGLWIILSAIQGTLDDAAAIISKRHGEPRAEGFRQEIAKAEEYYRRGVAEGIRKLEAEVLRLHPEWAKAYMPQVMESVAPRSDKN